MRTRAARPGGLGRLTATERRVLAGATELSDPPDPAADAFDAHPWCRHRLRAAFVAWWLQAAPAGDVRIHGALVDGPLDLTGQRLDRAVALTGCRFTEPVTLDGVTARGVELSASLVPGLSARGLACDRLAIDKGAVVRGLLDLNAGAFGHVTLTGLLIDNPGKLALDGNVLTTRRSFELNGAARVRGNVRFIGAEIGGQFNARGCHVEGRFSLHEATIARALYLPGVLIEGRLNLANAHVRGWVNLTEAIVVVDEGNAILLDNIEVGRTLQLTRAIVRGVVHMSGARVHGMVRLTRCAIDGGRRIPQSDPQADAAVRWSADALAHAGQRVAERRARLAAREPEPEAPPFESDPLTGVVALVMERCSFDSDLEIIATSFRGQVSITGTEVARRLDLRLTRFESQAAPAFLLADCDVGVALRWRDVTVTAGDVVFDNVRARALDDDPGSWPAGRHVVRGLTYETSEVDGAAWSVRKRIEWLAGQREHSSRPYEVLANRLLASGRRDDAWRVLRAAVDRRPITGRLRRPKEAGRWMSRFFFGHGYQPERAIVALLAVLVAGAVAFAWRSDDIVARDPKATVKNGCTETACFNPVVYSLDVGLPVVDLGATDTWAVAERQAPGLGWAVVAETALGWFLTTAAVASVTRRVVKG